MCKIEISAQEDVMWHLLHLIVGLLQLVRQGGVFHVSMAVPNVTAALSKIIISHCRKTILLVVYAAKCIMSCVYSIHCVSKNAPTLASCSLAKQHQYTFKDDMHIQLSLSLHFYLLYLLLRRKWREVPAEGLLRCRPTFSESLMFP